MENHNRYFIEMNAIGRTWTFRIPKYNERIKSLLEEILSPFVVTQADTDVFPDIMYDVLTNMHEFKVYLAGKSVKSEEEFLEILQKLYQEIWPNRMDLFGKVEKIVPNKFWIIMLDQGAPLAFTLPRYNDRIGELLKDLTAHQVYFVFPCAPLVTPLVAPKFAEQITRKEQLVKYFKGFMISVQIDNGVLDELTTEVFGEQ
jgi:hypothetical protein